MSFADPKKVDPRKLALLVALAGFMELFDGTVIQTALPSMGHSLGVSAASVSVTMAAYFAAAAGAIPVCSWLTERLGPRTAFTAGILVFAVASLLCGISGSLGWLVTFRILQGIGGAVMMTVGQIAILRDAPKDQLLNITAYLVWPALAAPVIAPVVGGLVTDSIGWRWLFLINLPIGLFGVVASLRVTPPKAQREGARSLDFVGATLLSLGLCSVIPGLGMVEAGANSVRMLAILGGTIALLLAVIWLQRHDNPLLRLDTYRFATFRAGNGAGAIYRAVVSSVPVMLTLLFQLAYGYSAVNAGLLVMVIFFGNLSIKPFANYSVRRWGYRTVVIGATVLGAVAILFLGLISRQTSLLILVPLLYLSGAARSMGYTSYMTMQYLEVPKDEMATASPLSNTVQQVATAFGLAVTVGSVAVLEAAGNSSLAAYRGVFIGMAIVLALSAVWVARLPHLVANLTQK